MGTFFGLQNFRAGRLFPTPAFSLPCRLLSSPASPSSLFRASCHSPSHCPFRQCGFVVCTLHPYLAVIWSPSPLSSCAHFFFSCLVCSPGYTRCPHCLALRRLKKALFPPAFRTCILQQRLLSDPRLRPQPPLRLLPRAALSSVPVLPSQLEPSTDIDPFLPPDCLRLILFAATASLSCLAQSPPLAHQRH